VTDKLWSESLVTVLITAVEAVMAIGRDPERVGHSEDGALLLLFLLQLLQLLPVARCCDPSFVTVIFVEIFKGQRRYVKKLK